MNWWFVLSTVLVAGLAAASPTTKDERKSYSGYRLIQIIPSNRQQLDFLHKLMINEIRLDFFSEPSKVGKAVEILVGPLQFRRLQVQLRKQNISFDVTIKNYQTVLDPMWRDIDKRRSAKGGQVFNINDFNTVDDIYSWMQTTLMSQCRSSEGFFCSVYTIGNTHLNRPINVFKLSKNGANRKAYWLDAAIHAREWIAPATVIKVLDALVRGSSPAAMRLSEAYDWYILPVMNVDGYEFTWGSDRLWRKNRRPNAGGVCIGTDLNRNFDFRWGNDGVSHIPCADIFCGEGPASEPETKNVQAEILRISSTLLATVTIHSYGNMWMFPWGNTVNYAGVTCERSADHNALMRISDLTANAIQATYGTRWERGNSCEVIYATTGGTDDWSKGVAGVANAFCPELRGNNFVILPSQIELSFNEFFNGIVAMVDSINGTTTN